MKTRTFKLKLLLVIAFLPAFCYAIVTMQQIQKKKEGKIIHTKSILKENCDTMYHCNPLVLLNMTQSSLNQMGIGNLDSIIAGIGYMFPGIIDTLSDLLNNMPSISICMKEADDSLITILTDADSGKFHGCVKILSNNCNFDNDSIIKICMKAPGDAKAHKGQKIIIKMNCDNGDSACNKKIIKGSKIIACKVNIKDVGKDEIKIIKDIPTDNPNVEMKIDKLNFFPNPNNGKFILSFMLEKKGNIEIKIIDMSGKEIYKESVKDFSGNYSKDIDISGKNKGAFFLIIKQGKDSFIKKIIVD